MKGRSEASNANSLAQRVPVPPSPYKACRVRPAANVYPYLPKRHPCQQALLSFFDFFGYSFVEHVVISALLCGVHRFLNRHGSHFSYKSGAIRPLGCGAG